MIDRRLFVVGAIALAVGFLWLIGLPPKVLWEKLHDFTTGATGAASATRSQSNNREKRYDEVGQIIDGLPGEKKDSWGKPKKRNP